MFHHFMRPFVFSGSFLAVGFRLFARRGRTEHRVEHLLLGIALLRARRVRLWRGQRKSGWYGQWRGAGDSKLIGPLTIEKPRRSARRKRQQDRCGQNQLQFHMLSVMSVLLAGS